LTRHIITLGAVDNRILDAVVSSWRADKIGGPLCSSESVLILIDQENAAPAEYVQALQDVDILSCPVGVLPISRDSASLSSLKRLVEHDIVQIDFEKSRFRLSSPSEGNLPSAPFVLRRGLQDDQLSVSQDLKNADFLVLQGHAGSVDAGFGPWLTLCSRHLYKSGTLPLFPCFGTDDCFRQELHGRPVTSAEGLVDPTTLQTPLLIVDGCGTFPLPGSLYNFDTSIVRSIMASEVRAAIMTHGVSATPLSAFVLFMAMLARGRTLGEAVREANHHQKKLGCPSSIDGRGVAPWILIGNPEAKVSGLPLVETAFKRHDDGIEFTLDARDVPVQTGTLVALVNVFDKDGPFDITCSEGCWARGTLHRDGCAYIWVSVQATGQDSVQSRVMVNMSRRPPDPASQWRERFKWFQANRGWLDRLASLVAKRSGDAEVLRSVISLRNQIGTAIEQVAFATAPYRPQVISPPLAISTLGLARTMEQIDCRTAEVIGNVLRFAGARLSYLWSPTWLESGSVRLADLCSCGCPIIGQLRRHPILELVRMELSCPACSLLGDVASRSIVNAPGSQTFEPIITGTLKERIPTRGTTINWSLLRHCDEQIEGFACAALFDPFRKRQVVTDVVNVPPLARLEVPMKIPNDWPEGLSWAAMIVTIGGTVSLLGFDIIVSKELSTAR
jgi:hypothetical protein